VKHILLQATAFLSIALAFAIGSWAVLTLAIRYFGL
jgi:hypothetical protein